MFLAIHVDEGLLMGEDEEQMGKLLLSMEKEFEITVTERPTSYLGLQIKKDKNGCHIIYLVADEGASRLFNDAVYGGKER